jgi:hypothetical protein
MRVTTEIEHSSLDSPTGFKDEPKAKTDETRRSPGTAETTAGTIWALIR